MWAELARPPDYGDTATLYVPDAMVPQHIYCDTCGDCLRCSPHEQKPWCVTGGRWVLYTDDDEDARIIDAARAAEEGT